MCLISVAWQHKLLCNLVPYLFLTTLLILVQKIHPFNGHFTPSGSIEAKIVCQIILHISE